MAEVRKDQGEINARIVYWGIPGAGISANIAMIHSKLKESSRGALRKFKTRIDPTVEYEVLPIELGKVHGVRARLHVIGAPGAAEQAPTRKQLLDRIDGVVFVADSRPECLAANVASLGELIEFLADYGYAPNDLPFVIQYNKCDLVDPFVIERLHREVQIQGAAVYEVSTQTGTGVLKTLTTISKQVIRCLGKRDTPKPTVEQQPAAEAHLAEAPAVQAPATHPSPAPEPMPAPPSPEAPVPEEPPRQVAPPAPPPAADTLELMERAILAEATDDVEADAAAAVASDAQALLDQPWDAVARAAKPSAGARIGADLRIVSVGNAARQTDRSVSVPIVLGNDDGETVTLAFTIQLDPLLDDEQ